MGQTIVQSFNAACCCADHTVDDKKSPIDFDQLQNKHTPLQLTDSFIEADKNEYDSFSLKKQSTLNEQISNIVPYKVVSPTSRELTSQNFKDTQSFIKTKEIVDLQKAYKLEGEPESARTGVRHSRGKLMLANPQSGGKESLNGLAQKYESAGSPKPQPEQKKVKQVAKLKSNPFEQNISADKQPEPLPKKRVIIKSAAISALSTKINVNAIGGYGDSSKNPLLNKPQEKTGVEKSVRDSDVLLQMPTVTAVQRNKKTSLDLFEDDSKSDSSN